MSTTEISESGGSNRRTFIKGVATLPVAAAGIGAMSAPASAGFWDDFERDDRTPGVGLEATAYFVSNISDHFGFDNDDYGSAQKRNLIVNGRSDFRLAQEANKNVIDGVNNLAENARLVAYTQARSVVLEELNEGTGIADAQIKAEDEIKDYFAPSQRNLGTRWNQVIQRMRMVLEQAEELEDYDGDAKAYEDPDNEFFINDGGITRQIGDIYFEDTELVNGDSIETYVVRTGGSVTWHVDDGGHWEIVPDPDDSDSSRITVFESEFEDAWDNLLEAYNKAIDDIRDFVDGIEDDYNAGDIDTEDIVKPSDMYGSGGEFESYAEADLAFLNLEQNLNSTLIVELLDGGEIYEGNLYLSQTPLGEKVEVDTVYDPTISRSTDDDGETVDSIDDYEGDENDPVPVDGVVYMAFVTEEGSDYMQVDQPFEVIGAFDDNDEEVSEVEYAPSQGQQSATTDAAELQDELQAMNDKIIEVEEERAELAAGGGGAGVDAEGFLSQTVYGIPLIGWIVAALGLGIYFDSD